MKLIRGYRDSLGWAFLLAWVFCVFYSGTLDGLSSSISAQSTSIAQELLLSVLPVSFAILSLALAVAFEPKLGTPAQSKALVITCPVLTCMGTLIMLLPAHDVVLSNILFALAGAMTGFGSGLMWIMWGQLYARMPQDAVEFCAPTSAVCAAVLSMAVMLLPNTAAFILVAVFPLISGLIFRHAQTTPETSCIDDRTSRPARPLPLHQAAGSLGHAGFGILAACFFVSLEGSFWDTADASSVQTAGIFITSALFMLVVGWFATSGPRRVSLAYAYRWMCPLMVAGFALIIMVGPRDGSFFAASVGIASRFAFCLITQMYFASYAARGAATPVQAYGMGWIFVHLGDFLGVSVFIPLNDAIKAGAVDMGSAAAFLIVALVTAVMFALNDGSRFLAWELPGQATAHATGSIDAMTGANAARARTPQPMHAEANGSKEEALPADDAEGTSRSPENAQEADTGKTETVDRLAERVNELANAHKLTKRETEVFGLLAHGRSIPYVRDALLISRDTAATHAKHIYAKLGVHSRQELISMVEGNAQAD